MRTLVIINNIAARARRAWPVIEKQLAMSGIEYEVYKTNGPADATTQTRAALKAGATTIAVVGGDGTLSEAAEGFFDFNEDVETLPAKINPFASLAILPAGTGDDFARGTVVLAMTVIPDWLTFCMDSATDTESPLFV